MGKKQKGGRRQILQLEDKKPPRSSSKNRIKNVIHYSDSDEDSKKSNDSEHSSGAGNKDNCPLDSEVAVFFKEIDALTVNEESTDTNENSVTVENQSGKENTVNSFEGQNSSIQSDEKLLEGTNTTESGVKAYCPWQEITDDSTGYSYYWNVETNDVTWDCPEEYAAYITAMNSNSQVKQNEEMESLKELQRKKESQLVEGAIIPITYFGDSSSSEESEDSDNNCNMLSNRRKEKSSKIKSCKVGLAKTEYDEIDAPLYGPVLPPELIPEEVAEKNLELSSNLKNAVCDIESRIVDQSKMSLQKETFAAYKGNSETLHNTCDMTSSQSVVNIPFIGPSISNHCENFERTYNKGEENPEPTVKPNDMLTSTGLALVEYSSFSEDEEEIESSSLSPMKHNVASNVTVPSPVAQFCNEEKSAESKELEATKSVTEMVDISFNKRKNDESSEELLDSSVTKKAKKSKPSNVLDIDGMFASHLSNQKHGFGFVKHHIEFNDSDSSCSDHNQDYRTNNKNDYKSVSFVKSEYVLDLNELNGTISPKEFGPTLLKDDRMLKNQSSQNSLDKNIENDIRDKENYMKKNVVNVKEDDVDSTVKKDLNVEKIMDCEVVSAGIHSKTISTEEEDIEEIDKILCEAFKKKRLENASRNTSLSTVKMNSIMSANVDSLILKPQLKDVKNNSTRVEVHEKGESNENKPAQEKNKDSILDLSSLLVDKLTFLISNHSPLSSLSVLLAQLQTRLTDWQAAALETKYFVARLQDVNQYVCQYEMGIVSGDWICHWDRENKSYYYVNTKTQHSQWTYPDDQSVDTKASWIQSKTEIPTSASSLISEQDEHQTVSSSSPEDSTKNKLKSCKSDTENQSIASSKQSCRSSPPPPPPGVDSPPPPPPCNPPPLSPPLPPSDNTEAVCDLTEDMDLENSNDSCSQIIISNSNIYETNQIHCSSMLVCSSSSSISNFSESGVINVTSSLHTTKENPNISRSHQTSVFNTDNDNKTFVLWSAPIPSCSSEVVKYSEAQTSAVASTNSIVTSQTSDNVFDPCLSSSSVTYLSSTDDVPNKANTSSGTTLKKEKKKMKLQSVLALKKKNIPSLVEKWQKIKEEQAKEDIS